MPLRPNQAELSLDTLYSITPKQPTSQPKSIWIKDGSVNVYGSSGIEPADAPTGMQILEKGDGVTGLASIISEPVYIYVSQAEGVSTEIVLTGFDVKEIVAE